jgi:hypothetical protein
MKKVKAILALFISAVVIVFLLFGSFPIATKVGGILIYLVCMAVILSYLSRS